MYILGISCFYHDAAACLIKDGQVLAAAEEERFTRLKHDNRFPTNAVEFCLKQAGIKIKQVDYVCFYEKPFLKFERILYSALGTFPNSFRFFVQSLPIWLKEKLWMPQVIKKELKYKGEVLFIDHHLSHAASSFLVSPFEKSVILTLDAVGEWVTTAYGYGDGTKIVLEKEIDFPHSLGMFYSAFTYHLGFEVMDGEYKVMGLASYGKPRYVDQVKKVIKIRNDGSYELNMNYFAYHQGERMTNSKFDKLFGAPRKKDDPVTKYHEDLAASLQAVTEEIIIKMCNFLYDKYKINNLCLAGGVALNCVANGKIIKKTPFKNIFIQPAAGDAGGSLGAALYVYNCLMDKPRNYQMDNAYLGPSFTPKEIESFLKSKKIKYQKFDEKEIVNKAAKLIAEGNVIGWFHNRMEFGPRALGHRSILANATSEEMKEIINMKVKHREPFRPFAPSVLAEEAPKYFDLECESPFMLLVADVKKDKRKIIPAITHVDGTARPQTVKKEVNGRYYDLISQYYKLTGVPVILNTSFNVRGEPIVCTPENAYNCFIKTDIDYLVLEKFLISKKEMK
jgi:carbamoyltransferase